MGLVVFTGDHPREDRDLYLGTDLMSFVLIATDGGWRVLAL